MTKKDKQAADASATRKSSGVSLLTGVLILVIGIVLIICNKMITGHGVVVLAGILFLLTGVVNLVLYVTRKEPDGTMRNRGMALFFGWLVSLAAIILGLCMLVFNATFNALIPFIFGLLVFFGAVMLAFTMLFNVRKVFKVPGWMWCFPGVMVVLGIVTLMQPPTTSDPLVMILTGSAMILFGLAGMLLGAMASGIRRQVAEKGAAPEVSDVEAKELESAHTDGDA